MQSRAHNPHGGTLYPCNTSTLRCRTLQAELMSLLENEDLARTPIIVLANKQDLKDAMQVGLVVHTLRKADTVCCAVARMQGWDAKPALAARSEPRWPSRLSCALHAPQTRRAPSPPRLVQHTRSARQLLCSDCRAATRHPC